MAAVGKEKPYLEAARDSWLVLKRHELHYLILIEFPSDRERETKTLSINPLVPKK